MVTKEDIEHVAKLMKIDIGDANEYFERIQKILNYFDSLDKADVGSEEIQMHEISINDLRDDKYIPFELKLISSLKTYKGSYVRAPKMS
jgi:aspartyl-tRNA(Asn)/glutamyl-tRNA(Gln) amidotransferase subunit C